MKPVNSPIGTLSTASKGGNPPDITIVSERTMKSIPRVVMKLGISNLGVMNAYEEADSRGQRIRPRFDAVRT